MTSILAALFTSGVYTCGYCPSEEHAKYLHDAKDLTQCNILPILPGVYHFTGILSESLDKPISVNNIPYVAVMTNNYKVFRGGSIGLNELKIGIGDELVHSVIQGNGRLLNGKNSVNIDQLLPKMFFKFGKKITDNPMMHTDDGENISSEWNFSVNLINLQAKFLHHVGSRTVKYGLQADTASYTIVAFHNGHGFCNKSESLVEQNTTIQEMRDRADVDVAYYGWMTSGLAFMTIGLGILDYQWFVSK